MSPPCLLTPAACCAAREYISKPLEECRIGLHSFDLSALFPLVSVFTQKGSDVTWRSLQMSRGEDIHIGGYCWVPGTPWVTFLKDLAKGSHLHFFFFLICSSSESGRLLWASSSPERSYAFRL